jgi:hypothetical protein
LFVPLRRGNESRRTRPKAGEGRQRNCRGFPLSCILNYKRPLFLLQGAVKGHFRGGKVDLADEFTGLPGAIVPIHAGIASVAFQKTGEKPGEITRIFDKSSTKNGRVIGGADEVRAINLSTNGSISIFPIAERIKSNSEDRIKPVHSQRSEEIV